jgi:hypothetical protein
MLQPWRFFAPFAPTGRAEGDSTPSGEVVDALKNIQQQLNLLVEKVSRLESQIDGRA